MMNSYKKALTESLDQLIGKVGSTVLLLPLDKFESLMFEFKKLLIITIQSEDTPRELCEASKLAIKVIPHLIEESEAMHLIQEELKGK